MFWKTVSAIMMSLLVLGTLALVFNFQQVKASGTIYIRADGSIDPPTANITTLDYITYTFIGNINDSILVYRSNIIVDGAGYTLDGTLFLDNLSNVTVKRTNVSHAQYGIVLDGSSHNTIMENNITSNYEGVVVAWHSDYNVMMGNNITSNEISGIRIEYYSYYNIISSNNVTGNEHGIWTPLPDPPIIPQTKYTAIFGNTMANNTYGIDFKGTYNSDIYGNNITNNECGIYLDYSSNNNSISGNNVTANKDYGIGLGSSSNNTISGNNIANNSYCGIVLASSSNYNAISGNNVTANNHYGIQFASFASLNNVIYHNNFIDNTQQVQTPAYANFWDDGYPSGGNYWSDYTGVDANSDGIGETPYVIDVNNTDRYPLVNPWTPTPAAPDFSITAASTSLAIQQGSSSTSTMTITSMNGFNQPVQLTISGAPSGVTTTLNPQQATPPADGSTASTLAVSVATTATPGSYTLTVTGTSEALTRSMYIFVEITAAPPPDTTAPALIQDFTASDKEDGSSILHWTNPSDNDLAEVIVKREIEEYPLSHSDGELVCKITSPSPSEAMEFVDQTLVNGRIYAYAVFSRDSAGNWNDVVREGKNADRATPMNPANQLPIASFAYSPGQPKVGTTITFNALSSSDDGKIVLYEWDWDGDGRYDWSTSNPQVGFMYETSGVYTVGLRVTDDEGALNTYSAQVAVAGLHWWEKARDSFPWSNRVRQLTNEEYQYIKNQLYIFAYEDNKLFSDFNDYYDANDRLVGSQLIWYTDWDLKDALNMEMDHEQSPGLTYGVYLFDALKEMEKVEQVWTQGYKLGASKYFSDLLDANSKWTSERTTKTLLDTIKEILIGYIEYLQPTSGVLGAGIDAIGYVNDCVEAGVPVAALIKLLYYNSLWRYFDLRHSGESHESAWQELIEVPTEDYHIPTNDPRKLAVIESYFKRLYDSYGSYLDDWDAFQREVKRDLRVLVLKVLESSYPVGHVMIVPHSPIEVRVYDPYGRVTGLINGQACEEIPMSACDNETGVILIYSVSAGCRYKIVGKADSMYGLDIAYAENGNVTLFSASNIPTTPESVHEYEIDWTALSQGGEGVIIQVDSNGDGVFEYDFTSDSELSRIEYVAATTKHDLGITGITSSKSVTGEGYTLPINVTTMNYGVYAETFNVTFYVNTNFVASQTVTLAGGNSTTVTFAWNTTGFAKGNYTITAYTEPVLNETYIVDNNVTCVAPVHVGVPGDVSGTTPGVYDGIVNMKDIAYLVNKFNTKPISPNWMPNADVNDDLVCNMKDIAIAVYYFNQHE